MDKWEAEGRPVTTELASYAPATLTAHPRPGLFDGKDEMLAAIGDGAVCSLNALGPTLHSGGNPRYYARGVLQAGPSPERGPLPMPRNRGVSARA